MRVDFGRSNRTLLQAPDHPAGVGGRTAGRGHAARHAAGGRTAGRGQAARHAASRRAVVVGGGARHAARPPP